MRTAALYLVLLLGLVSFIGSGALLRAAYRYRERNTRGNRVRNRPSAEEHRRGRAEGLIMEAGKLKREWAPAFAQQTTVAAMREQRATDR